MTIRGGRSVGQRIRNQLDVLATTAEYLLEVRQRELAQALSEASKGGDREWMQRLRTEIDEINQLLQTIRMQSEEKTGVPHQ